MKTRSVARGAVTVAIGGLVSKIIGAAYRLPLTNLIGAEGIGLYQMVFPVYCALLTFSSTGLPSAISKLVGENEENADKIFSRSLMLFGTIGMVGSALMLVLGGFISEIQGNASAGACYRAMSPSVFTVSVISCVRGYFQGRSDMRPTAVSQITEQAVKTVFGLTACYFFAYDVKKAATAAALAVTVSEVAALIYLLIKLRISGYKKQKFAEKPIGFGKILALTVPVGLAAFMLPLGHFADSFIIINVLGRNGGATELYGIYSGSVAALTGVPVAVAYGAAVACVPAISRGENSAITDALRFTGLICIPFTLFFTFFAKECIDLTYGGMNALQRFNAAQILGVDAISVTLLSFLQTVNAILVARGKQRLPVYTLAGSLIVRAALCAWFCSISSVGIIGAPAAANLSLAFALAINIVHALKNVSLTVVLNDITKCVVCSLICVLAGFYVYNAIGGVVAFVCFSAASAACYVFLTYIFGPLKETFRVRPGGKKKSVSA